MTAKQVSARRHHRPTPIHAAEYNMVKYGICCDNVGPSSVCHTRESRLNGSRYQNTHCTIRYMDASSSL